MALSWSYIFSLEFSKVYMIDIFWVDSSHSPYVPFKRREGLYFFVGKGKENKGGWPGSVGSQFKIGDRRRRTMTNRVSFTLVDWLDGENVATYETRMVGDWSNPQLVGVHIIQALSSGYIYIYI